MKTVFRTLTAVIISSLPLLPLTPRQSLHALSFSFDRPNQYSQQMAWAEGYLQHKQYADALKTSSDALAKIDEIFSSLTREERTRIQPNYVSRMQEIQGICYYKLASATGDGKLYGNAIRVIEESKKDSPVALAALALSYRRISDAHGYKALSRKSNDIIRSMMQMLHTREYPLNPGNGWGKTTIYVVDPHNKMLDMGVKMLYCDEIVQEALDLNTVDRPPAIFFPSAICPPVAINGDAGKLLSTLRENTTDSSRRDGEYSQSLPALFMERYFPLFHHMNNLGLGYLVLSQEKDAAGNIGKAIESFNKAVALADNDLRRARIDPQSNRQGLFNVDNFAAVQNNLGVAYVMLSNYSEREKNLAAAARCFTQALQYYTEKDYPILHQSMLTSLDAVNKSLREQQSKTVTAEEDRVRQNKTGKAEKN